MAKKIRVGVIFGGKSAEHEVSLQSAKNVIEALDQNKYEPVLIGIDKTGKWLLAEHSTFLLHDTDPRLIKLNSGASQGVALVPQGEGKLEHLDTRRTDTAIDVAFPILHGPFGEDGTVQGLLKLANIPFVGASVLGSAVGMDKDVMKRLLRDAGIPVVKFLACREHDTPTYEEAVERVGSPLFIKPASTGSSIGVNKVIRKDEYERAIREAFAYDRKVLIEECVEGREIECSVLGNDEPIASVPGEVVPRHEFYSYEAKYIDERGASLEVPAALPEDVVCKIQALAIKAFKTLECEGMGRIDFFLKKDRELLVNEINTIPGFTSISMYPRMWEASGISYSDLIDRLIGLAFERFEKERRIRTSYREAE